MLTPLTLHRLYAFTLVALGGQSPDLRDLLLDQLLDGPHRLLALLDDGTLDLVPLVAPSGALLLVVLVCAGGQTAPLVDVDARRLGVTDEEMADLGRLADRLDLVAVEAPDTPEGAEG